MGAIDLPSAYNPRAYLSDLRTIRCERDLAYFIREAWHIVEPGTEYVENWHIEMICEHLMAIAREEELEDGDIYNRLLINVPPGMQKSLTVGVFWPAWIWGPFNRPNTRFLCASHSQALAVRDNVRMRRLVSSQWYQERWGHRVKLTGDQNAKTKFENEATGFREAVATGSITGSRGDIVIIDDPHSVEGASSEQMRATTAEWFLEAVPTRLNHPKKSAIVVIMQRLHEEDVSGIILEHRGTGLDYDHIMLPMRYEPSRSHPTKLGFEDPRTIDGELLFSERFPLHVVDRDERVLGPFATAGQMQQSPVPRGGGLIKDDWWTLYDPRKYWGKETDDYPVFEYIAAIVDTAYTEKEENDPSAAIVFGVFSPQNAAQITNATTRDGKMQKIERRYAEGMKQVMLMYAWHGRLAFPELCKKIVTICKNNKVDAVVIEKKAAGASVTQELRKSFQIEDFDIFEVDAVGDKWNRLFSVQGLFSQGLIWSPDKVWSEEVIREVGTFPKGKHDDYVDCVAHGLRFLRRSGLLSTPAERIDEIEKSKVYHGRSPAPLYPS